MFKILLALHLLTAIFAIGPLVGAVTTASRGLRTGDAAAAQSSARTLTVYSYASIVVVVLGLGLMSAKAPSDPSQHVADFGDAWIWLSVLLWAASLAIVFGAVIPTLKRAAAELQTGNAVGTLTGRVAAFGGMVGVLYAVIVFLMVYRPGS
jgi:hypothetical protein